MPRRKMFPNSVIPLPATPGPAPHGLIVNTADQVHRAEPIDVSFSLGLSPAAQKELQERVDRGEVISPEEMLQKYSVDAATADSLQNWLKGEGFSITEVS